MKADPATEFEDLFPAKLHYVLEQVESDDVDGRGVISWQPHGRAFVVRDREKFVKQYLPNWFRQTTWSSFQRQLNHYNFKRITSDRNAYYHPSFVKGDRSQCRNIHRVKVKGTGPRKPSKPDDQPNFYQPPPSGPFPGVERSRALPPPPNGDDAAAAPRCDLPAPTQVCSLPTFALSGTAMQAWFPQAPLAAGLGPLSIIALLSGPLAWPLQGTLPFGPLGRTWVPSGPPPACHEVLHKALMVSEEALQGWELPHTSTEGSP